MHCFSICRCLLPTCWCKGRSPWRAPAQPPPLHPSKKKHYHAKLSTLHSGHVATNLPFCPFSSLKSVYSSEGMLSPWIVIDQINHQPISAPDFQQESVAALQCSEKQQNWENRFHLYAHQKKSDNELFCFFGQFPIGFLISKQKPFGHQLHGP